MIRFDVVTLFPEMFTAITGSGITSRALEAGLYSLTTWNPRDFATDNYRTVDDRPYGGGPGMVMLAEPLERALDRIRQAGGGRVIYLSPQGRKLDHRRAMELKEEPALTLLCDKRIDHASYVGQRIRPCLVHGLGHRADERAQRQRLRRVGADDPPGPLPRRLGTPQHFVGEPGLTHTGGSGDQNARVVAARSQGAANASQFAVAPGQRLGADHSATITLRERCSGCFVRR